MSSVRNRGTDLPTFLHEVLNITDRGTFQSVITHAKVLQYSKRDTILRPDDHSKDYLFLIQGKTREYLIDENGHDITFRFLYDPGDILLNENEYIQSGSFYWEAMGRTWVMQIEKSVIDKALQTDFGFRSYIDKTSRAIYAEQSELHYALMTMQAKERYQWFLDHYDDFPSEIPQKHIATFLKMLPQTLSEVRSQLYDSD